ncbi:MAG: TonB-dependent receptor, partial [Acidobacteria bacterium]|nr:TonB-dependent receptor [Acidobacteriota bacterium]
MFKKSNLFPERFTLVTTAFLVLTCATWVSAQLPTASVLGVVKDTSGALVPEATVTARNIDTGQTRSTVSASDGSFRLPALLAGNYEVRAAHAGFQTEVRSGLTLAVAQDAVVNFTLTVGAVEQTVTVMAEASMVNTTSGTLGGLVDSQKVADLPLNGRNFMDLTLLQPGIQKTNVVNSGPVLRGVWISSNGASGRSNAYLLDGAPLQSFQGSSPAGSVSDTSLGIEGIQEFRVVTTLFSAEYGMVAGSQSIIASKGGTNNFHGSAFEFFRNSALDARNFFDRITAATPRRLPAFVRNNFGGSLGGPIKQDTTFFSVVYERALERVGRTIISNVIPVSAKVDGGLVPQISPIVRPFLKFFPDPNLPNAQYTFSPNQPSNDDYGQTRIDQTFSNRDSLFGRYTIVNTDQTLPSAYPQFSQSTGDRGQFVTLSETHIFSPTLLNTLRASFSRTIVFSDSAIAGVPEIAFVSGQGLGSLNIGGVSGLSAATNGVNPQVNKQNIFTYSDDMYYTRGSHSLKFGTLINHYQMWIVSSLFLRGQATFANLQTFLSGGPVVSISALTPGTALDKTFHLTTLGFYLQDDWRVRSNLTLNLGLRYEPTTDLTEVQNHQFELHDVINDVKTTAGLPFLNPSKKNISPRIGFAWDVAGNGKTAIRGGAALLYDVVFINGGLLSNNNPPRASTSTVLNVPTLTLPFTFPQGAAGNSLRQPDYHMRQPHLFQYSLTVERQLPYNSALTLSYVQTRGLNQVAALEGNPTVPQGIGVNGVCVQAPAGQALDLKRPNLCWLGSELRMNPNWGGIDYRAGASDSWYNGLQVQ